MGLFDFFRKKPQPVAISKPTPPQLLPAPTPDEIEAAVDKEIQSLPAKCYLPISVVGVTYKNGRRSRQSILRQMYWKDGNYSSIDYNDCLTLNSTEFEGEPAIEIWVHTKKVKELVGYVAKEHVPFFIHNFDNLVSYEGLLITGGGTASDGSVITFGLKFTAVFVNAVNLDGTPVPEDESNIRQKREMAQRFVIRDFEEQREKAMVKLNADYCFDWFCYTHPAYRNASYEIDKLKASAYYIVIHIVYAGSTLCSVRYDRKENDIYCYDKNYHPF